MSANEYMIVNRKQLTEYIENTDILIACHNKQAQVIDDLKKLTGIHEETWMQRMDKLIDAMLDTSKPITKDYWDGLCAAYEIMKGN